MYTATKHKILTLQKTGVFAGAAWTFFAKGQFEDSYLGFSQTVPTPVSLHNEHVFDVASLTKVICTTTVILQWLEQGRIELDQPLHCYYPAFKDERVTIRHLLTHTGDLQGYIENRDQLSKEQLISAYAQLCGGAQLGQKVAYTDAGFILLGLMIRELTGQTVKEVFQTNVLDRVEMKASFFMPDAQELQQAFFIPTENHSTRGLIQGAAHDPKAHILGVDAGNAGLFSPLTDVKKFILCYLNEGKASQHQLLLPATVKTLLTEQWIEASGLRTLGWRILRDHQGTPLLFHTGYTGTFLLLDVMNQEAFAFLSNRIHPADHRDAYLAQRDELLKIYLQEKGSF